MKLVFPGGEHPHMLLAQGVNRVGSAPDASIQLPGLPREGLCELHLTRHGVMLQVMPGASEVAVNGRIVSGVIALRTGDLVSFDGVAARMAERGEHIASSSPVASSDGTPRDGDPQATVVRPTLSSHMLRSMSDIGFGRSHVLAAATTIGRAPESGLPIDHAGLSRTHARVTPEDHAILVEDLGSTNGTFINGRRVARGRAVHGDELRLDTLRFRIVAPVDAVSWHAAKSNAPRSRSRWRWRWWWIGAALLAVLAIVAAWLASG